MLRSLALVALAAGAAGEAIELTDGNFDRLVFQSGKSSFIKFLAPWWGHCKSMKPDWDELGEKYESSKKVLIGDCDCTGPCKATCERMGVEGYPTIKYFNPPDTEGEKYEGGRTLKELKKFAKTLGPGCTRATFDKCSAKQKEELQPFLDMADEELEAAIEADKTKLKEAQEAHDALMKRLQSEFQASEEKLKALKDDLQPQLKLMKAAAKPAAAAPAADAKDEM